MDMTIMLVDELHKELGSGAYGAVSVIDDERAFKRFYNKGLSKYDEIAVLSSIDHPNIVSMLAIGVYKNDVGVIMELCEMTLDEYLTLPISNNVPEYYPPFMIIETSMRLPFKTEHYLDACHQLLSGISCLHSAKITHADIKGNNIMIKNGRLIICDFGLAIQSHVSGKRDIDLCATLEWRPLDIVYLTGNSEFNKIIPDKSEQIDEWCRKVSKHYYGVIELYQVDIYSIGLIILSILIGKTQPHSPLDEPDMFILLEDWHRNCTIRSPTTMRNYLRRMDGWPIIPEMADFLSRLISSSPWNRYHNINEALNHKLFKDHGFFEPIKGIHHRNQWRITKQIKTLDKSILQRAYRTLGSYGQIKNKNPGMISEEIIYLTGYLHYINELRLNITESVYKFNSKIETDDFLINTAMSMTMASLYNDAKLEVEAKRNGHPSMFDDYLILTKGRMFLEAEWSTSSLTRLSPLGFYLQAHTYGTLTEYIIAIERNYVKNSYLAISNKYKLSNDKTRLNITDYSKMIADILLTI